MDSTTQLRREEALQALFVLKQYLPNDHRMKKVHIRPHFYKTVQKIINENFYESGSFSFTEYALLYTITLMNQICNILLITKQNVKVFLEKN